MLVLREGAGGRNAARYPNEGVKVGKWIDGYEEQREVEEEEEERERERELTRLRGMLLRLFFIVVFY